MEAFSLVCEKATRWWAAAGADPVQPGAARDSLCGRRGTAEPAARRACVGGDRRAVGHGAGAAVRRSIPMGGGSLGTRSHAASSYKRVGAGALGASRMGGRALGGCGGRWPWRGLGAGALGGGDLGTGALDRGTDGRGVDPWTPWASGRLDTWPLAVRSIFDSYVCLMTMQRKRWGPP
jgi:hypothetical protein